jgi:hypothetical protein
MSFHLSIGITPFAEDCAQLGREGYELEARRECLAFINQLKRHYSERHGGAELPCRLDIKENPHDFGIYLDVVGYYGEGEPAGAEAAAFWLESNTPEFWDAEAYYTDLGRQVGFDVQRDLDYGRG